MDHKWNKDEGTKIEMTPEGDAIINFSKSDFPNLATRHVEGCKCVYCESGVDWEHLPKDHINLNDPKRYSRTASGEVPVVRPKKQPVNNSIGEKIDYVELGPVTKEQVDKVKKDFAFAPKCKIKKESVDKTSMKDILNTWMEIEKKEEQEKLVAAQKALEDRIGVESTVDYQTKNQLKGLVVFYINISALSSDSEWSNFLKKFREENKEVMERFPLDWEKIYIPIRSGENKVEMLRF